MFLLLNKNRPDQALEEIEGYIFDDSRRELDDKNIEYCMARRMTEVNPAHEDILNTLKKWYIDNALESVEAKDINEFCKEFGEGYSLIDHDNNFEVLLYLCMTPEESIKMEAYHHLCIGFTFCGDCYRYDISLKGLIHSDETARREHFKFFYRNVSNREYLIGDSPKLLTFPLAIVTNKTEAMQYPPYGIMRVSRSHMSRIK